MDTTFIFYIFTALFGAFLIVGAIFDAWKFIIPNAISVGIVVLFFGAATFEPIQTSWFSHLGAFASVFLIGLLLFGFQLLGAGDVKLLAAVSLWAGFENLPLFLAVTALAGGALAMALIMLRRLLLAIQIHCSPPISSVQMPPVLSMGGSVPYGLAIAVGGLSQVYNFPHLLFYIVG